MTVQNNNTLPNNWIITEFPDDCLLSIFEKSEAKDVVCSFSLTCRKWNIVSTEEKLWRHFCIKDHFISEDSIAKKAQNIAFLELYQCTSQLLVATVQKFENGALKHDFYSIHKFAPIYFYDGKDLTIIPYLQKAWDRFKKVRPEVQNAIYQELYNDFQCALTYHQSAGRISS